MPKTDLVDAIAENRGWFIALGVLLIVVGSAAILFPFASSIAVETIVGASLIVAGVGQMVHGIGNRKWGGFFFALIGGAIWLAAGVMLLVRPLEGIAVLTLVVAAAFVAEGIVRAVLAFRMRPHSGWGWVLIGGIVAVLVGIMLWAQFPLSAVWALGVLAGINILASGWGILMLAIASGADGRSAPTETATVS